MVYKLEFSKRFDRQFSKLDKSTQRYIFNWLIKHLDNVENPRYSGKSLTGNKQGLWRYRIGNYRVIVDISDTNCVIVAVEVGHRKFIYK
ncbi:MAG: type II toxin-antitoxin system RelE/ParE family toxin [Veillonella sp.]|uniref:type II toxin-antitoxin system RelE family toxin n=1 Tax=Veillonella sp. TaxID=1926307 RepID=UPI00291C32AE|nr:type II toxin-antitoxin system RelE/ParE family toxin [Veillonella sp.]MDU8949318.1 type II toxin-antitoxin system RelE/ParE family toxin [Veillonella sp.]